MGIAVEGVSNSEGSLVGQADPEGLEAGTQTRAVTRAAAQPQFTEAGMSRAQRSRGANGEEQTRSRCLLCRQSPDSALGSSPCTKT